VSQQGHTHKLLAEAWYATAVSQQLPLCEEGATESVVDDKHCVPLKAGEAVGYQPALGELLYLAGCTRPDTFFAVGVLGRYVTALHNCHNLPCSMCCGT
jgi:hypothetical protein